MQGTFEVPCTFQIMNDKVIAREHPFIERPNRTLLALAVPVFFSLIAEPLTGLVDTAFVARLGAEPLVESGQT